MASIAADGKGGVTIKEGRLAHELNSSKPIPPTPAPDACLSEVSADMLGDGGGGAQEEGGGGGEDDDEEPPASGRGARTAARGGADKKASPAKAPSKAPAKPKGGKKRARGSN